MTRPRIGLALSGGGSRAIAFHLGCLRALHELGILNDVEVISTVSGGSVIGAMYAGDDKSFLEFESRVRAVLARGLVRPAIKKAFMTSEGPRALLCLILLVMSGILSRLLFWGSWIASLMIPKNRRSSWWVGVRSAPIRRFASRTTILQRVFEEEIFKGQCMRDLSQKAPLLIVNAAELRTGSAFYFSPKSSGSWRLGKLATPDVTVGHAVTASAAYPLFLPALDEVMPFNRADGSRKEERVTLTDGGVYDNLGLAPLWPDRDPQVSLNVTDVDTIICCRAGYGLRHDPPSQFFLARLQSAFFCVHDRAQNAAMTRLFDLKAAGKLKAIMLPYLGQSDSRLKYPPDDLVAREEAYAYPTDFSAMPEEWIDKLSLRGNQLTKAMVAEHYPELLK